MGLHWGLPAGFQHLLPHPPQSQRPGSAPSRNGLRSVTFTRLLASVHLSYNLLICIIGGNNNYLIH